MKLKMLFATVLSVLLATGPVLAGEQRTAIHSSADQVQPLLPGMPAPAFELRDAAGQPVHFDPAALPKPLVLTFFRGGWCPYCNLHLAELRKAEAELKDLGFDVWFISVDKPELLYDSLQQPDIGYAVFSDAKLAATRAFGIAFEVPPELVEKYRGYGIDLEAASGETHHVLPAPSTFIIGVDGKIYFAYTNPDYTVRLHPDVLLAAARAYAGGADARLRDKAATGE
jgi:peroxiredoxin